MPERPSGEGLSWGERKAQQGEPSDEMVHANPWWEAVRQWRRAGDRGQVARQKVAFLGGMPRSGTTLLEMFVRSHGDVSSLTFPKESQVHEGLPLVGHGFQRFGGGSKGYYKGMCAGSGSRAHMTGTNRSEVLAFQRYAWEGWESWNFSKAVLAVKDPPNLLRIRFLQEAFEQTHDIFAIFTLKHPFEIASRFECDPWSAARAAIAQNWLSCHNAWLEDLQHIQNYLVVPFEAWFTSPEATGRAIEAFLNLQERVPVEFPPEVPRRLRHQVGRRLHFYGGKFTLSRKYFLTCQKQVPWAAYQALPLEALAAEYRRFGYDLRDASKLLEPEAFEPCMLGGLPCRFLA